MEIDIKRWLNRKGEVFLKDIGIKKGDIVLDFGCGNEPLWNLSDMGLNDVIGEINSRHFYLQRKSYKKLLHNNHYSRGYILNFRKK